jgi:hypothetical protein
LAVAVSPRAITTPRLPEPQAEEVRRLIVDAVRELQALPAASLGVLADVQVPDGQLVAVPHRLGRPPRFVVISAPRGPVSAGFVEEVRDGADRARVVVLRAQGYGATITVDVVVL